MGFLIPEADLLLPLTGSRVPAGHGPGHPVYRGFFAGCPLLFFHIPDNFLYFLIDQPGRDFAEVFLLCKLSP